MICGSREKICVDHCHTTGKVRGFLCVSCNVYIGKIQENPEVADKLKKYLIMCQLQKEVEEIIEDE